MATPCVLITSCSDYSPENIVKDILQVDTLQEGKAVIETVVSYDWSIDTKYYTADVRLCVTKERTIGNQEFADSVQAFIAYFDADKKETFGSVKLWSAYLKEIDPEIKILVCNRCVESSAVGRLEAQTWCIDNGFELVELDPEPVENDSDLEDDFVETTGLKRIIQSLHAHTWPNLSMKESRHSFSPFMRQLMKEEHESKKAENISNEDTSVTDSSTTDLSATKSEHCSDFQTTSKDNDCANMIPIAVHKSCNKCAENEELDYSDTCKCDDKDKASEECRSLSNIVVKGNRSEDEHSVASGSSTNKAIAKSDKSSKKSKQPTKEERIDSLLSAEDMSLFEAVGSEDPHGESFEKLFERFAQMKERANDLPFEERKKYAENVAIAFWKAIGGDEDEIGDLDSDS